MINRLILAWGYHTDRIKCTHKSGARDAIGRRGRKASLADSVEISVEIQSIVGSGLVERGGSKDSRGK